jgi:hypothetical protein
MMMSPTQNEFNHVVAFEVSKDNLVVHMLPGDRQVRLPNSPKAIRRLLTAELRRNRQERLGALLVVCEATGRYERHVLAACVARGVKVHRAHGARPLLRQVFRTGQDRPDRCPHARPLWRAQRGAAPL